MKLEKLNQLLLIPADLPTRRLPSSSLMPKGTPMLTQALLTNNWGDLLLRGKGLKHLSHSRQHTLVAEQSTTQSTSIRTLTIQRELTIWTHSSIGLVAFTIGRPQSHSLMWFHTHWTLTREKRIRAEMSMQDSIAKFSIKTNLSLKPLSSMALSTHLIWPTVPVM